MISVLLSATDPRKFEDAAARHARLLAGERCEVLPVDASASLSAGLNRAVAASRGDVLLFSQDDVEVLSPDLPGRLRHHLRAHDLVGVLGTTRLVCAVWSAAGPPYVYGQVVHAGQPGGPYEVHIYGAPRREVGRIQALHGPLLATTRDVVKTVRFDERTFDGEYLHELDFSYSAHLAGFRLGVCNDINVLCPVPQLGPTWERYALAFMKKFNLFPRELRESLFSRVQVQTLKEALEVMTPAYWDPVLTAGPGAAPGSAGSPPPPAR